MARAKVVEVKEVTQEEAVETVETDKKFEAQYNPDSGVVTFELTDGTSVTMSSPKTRQFLLLESFIRSAGEEYKTESFMALKLASLCISKFGAKKAISFDELLDTLEIEDVERVAAALAFFQNKFDYLSKAAAL